MEAQQTLGGRYTLLSVLGVGGMAHVWRARDEVLGRSVAVKVLAGRYADEPQSRARIRDEARAAATLSHPNIAQIYDFGESDEDGFRVPYVVMELVHGITLQERILAGPLEPQESFLIGGQVAAALAAAHADGLVHRDIKPANVIVTQAGAKVVDFGLAAAAGPGSPGSELLGTPAYLAPERLIGDAIEPASDVYALGVLLYRLLAGASPWTVDSTTQMLDAHVYVEPTPLPKLPDVPDDVRALVNRCLGKDPAERPVAAEAAAVLAEAAGVRGAATPVSPAPTGTPLPLPPPDRGPSPGNAASGNAASGKGVPGGAAAEKGAPRGGAAGNGVAGKADVSQAKGDSARSRRRRFALAGGIAVVVAGLAAWLLAPSSAEKGQAGELTVLPSVPSVSAPARTSSPADGATPTGPPGRQSGAGGEAWTSPSPPVSADVGSPSPTGLEPTGITSASPVTTPTGTLLTSDGGEVVASCDSAGKSRLSTWDPKPGWKVDSVAAGPALTTSIVFKHGNSKIRMTVTCVAGKPTAVVLPL